MYTFTRETCIQFKGFFFYFFQFTPITAGKNILSGFNCWFKQHILLFLRVNFFCTTLCIIFFLCKYTHISFSVSTKLHFFDTCDPVTLLLFSSLLINSINMKILHKIYLSHKDDNSTTMHTSEECICGCSLDAPTRLQNANDLRTFLLYFLYCH